LNTAASSAVKAFDSNLRTGTAMDYTSGHDAMSGAKTWIVALAWVGLALLLIFGRSSSPRDATTLMEYLADRAERAVTIHPLTAQEIERLMRQSVYDCRQVTCDDALATRNSLVRARLETVLVEKVDNLPRMTGEEMQAVAHAPIGSRFGKARD